MILDKAEFSTHVEIYELYWYYQMAEQVNPCVKYKGSF